MVLSYTTMAGRRYFGEAAEDFREIDEANMLTEDFDESDPIDGGAGTASK